MDHVSSLRFTIAANGFADGPAQALRERLVALGALRVTTILHPLGSEDGHAHELVTDEPGRAAVTRRIWAPSLPPWTYPLDLFLPPVVPRSDIWFGFNALACARGLVDRRLGRAEKVVYWCVDYVDDRFGGGALTRVFERLDEICCARSDLRVELTEVARDARSARHDRTPLAPSRIVPMGAWLDRVSTTTPGSADGTTIVYMGHLVERQGVETLIRAVALLHERGTSVDLAIIGKGPLREELQSLGETLGIADAIQFHGFVADHREVERLLAAATVAVAPYVESADSFTRFADPGKLKAYLAAGLPIVTTRVAPIAEELGERGAATLAAGNPESIAAAIDELLGTPRLWALRRAAALDVAEGYDWRHLLDGLLTELGVEL